MPRSFISYSRKDKVFVQELVAAIREHVEDIWVDWDDIPYSADWWREIQEGIDGAEVVVFVISPDSLASHVCNLEIAHARSANKHIVPIVRRDVEVDAKLLPVIVAAWFEKDWEDVARLNWTFIKKLNWLFFQEGTKFDDAVANLLKTMRQDLPRIKFHTQILLNAQRWQDEHKEGSLLLTGKILERAESWLELDSEQMPQPTELQREYIAASIQARLRREKISEYEQERNKALRLYVLPYLSEQKKVIEKRLQQATNTRVANPVTKIHSDEETIRQELNVIENFLGSGGKWHPQEPIFVKHGGAQEDYTDVYEFPCCRKGVWSDNIPSRFRIDGCEDAPQIGTE